ncbi:MAG: MotA/TolQ/ExbB proton channel family protein [Akkermansiaceae bacterium]|nr:MotA/TolQ/ExbB proton channel family protein [Akkermansiaceae bacterium]
MKRLSTALLSLGVAIAIVVFLNILLKGGCDSAKLLINKATEEKVYLSEQAFMWAFFCIGAGELLLRFRDSSREVHQLHRKILPEDESVVLTSKELPELYKRAQKAGDAYLPRLIQRIVRKFQMSNSSEQANSVMDSSLELFLHEIDLKYNMLRYIMWVIPTIGFIGTVRGIADGLNRAAAESHAGNTDDLLYVVSMDLGVAFYTTLLALVMSGVLVLMMHICQGREEGSLNQSGQYCIDHLINKLYNP